MYLSVCVSRRCRSDQCVMTRVREAGPGCVCGPSLWPAGCPECRPWQRRATRPAPPSPSGTESADRKVKKVKSLSLCALLLKAMKNEMLLLGHVVRSGSSPRSVTPRRAWRAASRPSGAAVSTGCVPFPSSRPAGRSPEDKSCSHTNRHRWRWRQ